MAAVPWEGLGFIRLALQLVSVEVARSVDGLTEHDHHLWPVVPAWLLRPPGGPGDGLTHPASQERALERTLGYFKPLSDNLLQRQLETNKIPSGDFLL